MVAFAAVVSVLAAKHCAMLALLSSEDLSVALTPAATACLSASPPMISTVLTESKLRYLEQFSPDYRVSFIPQVPVKLER